ncbi:hypothetical protein EYC84_011047 [Monilinia fructicola]|uniref:Uncharacterized protein n=1 Tax=Monilinia fructicola TaxID=38448 RepID=A0A5M9J836_MONFR|nr:hypothetical protein EYC84_011047 [Monilinia fructicola]
MSGGGGKSTAHPGLNKSPVVRVAPLSVEKTRRLAERCITTYLINRLKHDEADNSNVLSTSPKSPENRMTAIPAEYEHPRHFTNQTGSQAIPIRPPPPPGYGNGMGDRSTQRPGPRSMPYSTSSREVFSVPIWKKRDRLGSGTYTRPLAIQPPSRSPPNPPNRFEDAMRGRQDNVAKNLFRPLEEYIIASFSQFDCINTSFSTTRQGPTPRAGSQSGLKGFMATIPDENDPQSETSLEELDPRMLMLGDIAENGSWWTGNQKEAPEKTRVQRPGTQCAPTGGELAEIEETIMEAQSHLQRTLLKATESLLKRPGRPLKEPDNLRFLLIILANPLLYPGNGTPSRNAGARIRLMIRDPKLAILTPEGNLLSNYHRMLQRGPLVNTRESLNASWGFLSNTPNECHHHIVSWFARYPEGHFQRTTELVGSFVTYRLTRQHGKPREADKPDHTSGLIPQMSATASHNNVAAFHAALQAGQTTNKKKETKTKSCSNNSGLHRRGKVLSSVQSPNECVSKSTEPSMGTPIRALAAHGQMLPTSHFYNTLLDYSDLVADFEAWESKT